MQIFHIDQGTVVPLEGSATLPASGFLWIRGLREESPELLAAFAHAIQHEVATEHITDTENSEHPPHSDGTSKYDRMIARSIKPGANCWQFSSTPIILFLADRVLMSIADKQDSIIESNYQRLVRDGIRSPKRAQSLFLRILGSVADSYRSFCTPLSAELDTWQTMLIDESGPFDEWKALIERRRTLRFVLTLCEQHERAYEEWLEDPVMALDDAVMVRANDLLEHTRRAMTQARLVQAEMESIVQLHFAASDHRANQVMRVLTVVSAIFLPLNLIAGVFGMNFERIPGLSYRHGFPLTLAIMLLAGFALLFAFRRKRWF